MSYRSRNIINSFFRFRNLLFLPKKEWERVAHEHSQIKELFLRFAFPIITLCSLIAFAGMMIHKQGLGIGISQFFVAFLSFNLGIYSAAKIIELLAPNFQIQIKSEIIFQLVIYSASIFCLFHGIAKLFSPYSFLNQISLILELYFIRILWLGTAPLLPLSESKRPGFTIMASLLILVLPLIFERMFSIIFRLPVTI